MSVGVPNGSCPPNWTDEAWEIVTHHFPAVTLPVDACLLEQGQEVAFVWAVCAGAVKLVASAPSGRRAILGLRQVGSLVGAVSAVTTRPLPFGAYTVSRVKAVQMDWRSLERLLAEKEDVSLVFQRLLHFELADTLEDWASLSTLDAAGRIMHVLRRASAANARTHERVALRQFELAQAAMTSVQNLHRTVRKMEGGGMLERRNGWMSVRQSDDGLGEPD